ncbi:unnamed protein product [Notodromas monacha]|uniref:Pyrroline-5-carboxylate reductase n=1 Tax=Notodromas monacha TaxID=399045 RepID=A0A7R9GDF4_9CRUS|nr:unnamed protein product [Notodromas monacha]CAG0916906.1 unnamed protein product [Notodromas monacha]
MIRFQCPNGQFSWDKVSIGFIGAGQMAQAMAKGWIKAGVVKPDRVVASAPTNRNLAAFKELGCSTTNSNVDVLKMSNIIIIAVKPHMIGSVVEDLRSNVDFGTIKKQTIFISVAAGVPLADLEKFHFNAVTSVVRIMTNVAFAECQAMTASCFGSVAYPCTKEVLTMLFEPVGSHISLPESLMNVFVGMSGSGIAFMFSLLEGMSDGGVRLGLPRETSNTIAIQTMLGASLLAQANMGKRKLAELRESVCSPGGTTMAGLYTLEKNAVKAALMEAVEASCKRSEELGCAGKK